LEAAAGVFVGTAWGLHDAVEGDVVDDYDAHGRLLQVGREVDGGFAVGMESL
jgi:hypothetical protein